MKAWDPRDVIARKRDGGALAEEDLRAFVEGFVRGDVRDYQASALLMAVYLEGMDDAETAGLTRALVDSGDTVRLPEVDRPTVDKHSTGGVADGVTLVFAPLAAALGLAVAKLSGRGLGHTGGTLDKLEAVPGLRTDLSLEELRAQVAEIGCVVAGQTRDLVPADGSLYALRDATATVASVPLIAASVMSKKLAVETDLILLDVKAGSGALMKTPERARELAGLCVQIGRGWGRPVRAAVTDMSQPLGQAIGNALDIAEAIEVLAGRRRGRLREASLVFGAEAAQTLLGVSASEARARAERALDDGSALERFRLLVRAQGGDPRVVDDPGAVLPRAPVLHEVRAAEPGFVREVDAGALGRASGALGAGRAHKDDPVDPAVGIVFRPDLGDVVDVGEAIAQIHARDEESARVAAESVRAAVRIGDRPVEPPPLVFEWYA